MTIETQYARRGDISVAYQVLGRGPPDLIMVSSWLSHLEARWDLPEWDYFYRRLASFSRFISFDKYGVGLSDPAPPGHLPTLEEWVDDVGAVMDAVGSEDAAVVGIADGGFMALLFAATHPERTRSLTLLNCTARMSGAPDYDIGLTSERRRAILDTVEAAWGGTDTVAMINPSADRHTQEAWARQVRLAASPGTAKAVFHTLFELDVRTALASIRAPTLVLHQRTSPLIPFEHGRYLADNIPGARFTELPGLVSHPTVRDMDPFVDAIEVFVTGARAISDVDRVLMTVLFTDIVGSTDRLAQLGDVRWNEVLASHNRLAQRHIDRFQGSLIKSVGDGLLATFDGPARGVRCALALRDEVRSLGLEIRAGLHTGEVERHGDDVAGMAVHLAARIQERAGAQEILVSRTVKDLVAGSGIRFADRGSHELKGVPETWQLFAVEG
jgi:class 3 adenylate cyclase